ncbi:hypothetical protein D3C73_1005820 [compost metagenome]
MDVNLYPELYDAIYKNSVWPQDLLKNLSDSDYVEVKFDSYLDGLRSELSFMDEGHKIVTVYYFDKREFVQRIEMIESDSCITVYDRIADVTLLLEKIGKLDSLNEIMKLMAA